MEVSDTTSVTFSETAFALAELGWRPIPLVIDTKQPAEPGWNARNLTPWTLDELEQAIIYHGDAACGLAIQPEILALDVDVLDVERSAEIARLADNHLGRSPLIRIGLEPKFVAIYRAKELLASSKPHPLEVYSGSGQIAAYGWHAKAGRPYLWAELSPLDLAADSPEIPAVDAAALRAFLAAVRPVLAAIRGDRRRRGGNGSGIGLDAGEHLRRLMSRGLSFRRAARRVLEGADDGGRHYAIRAVVSAGYNRGMAADEILGLLDRCAPEALMEYVQRDGYVDRVLRAFEPRHSGRELWS